MESKTCCFIGHRNVTNTKDLYDTLKALIERLITQENVATFLFGSKSNFDDICLSLVSEMKNKYSHIKRVYVRSVYPEIRESYKQYLLELYDETYMPKQVENSGRASYIKRNKEMIDRSDFLVFYYDEHYTPTPKRQSGTRRAYEYATRKNKDGKKHVVNVYK